MIVFNNFISKRLYSKMSDLVQLSSNYSFGGFQKIFSLDSKELGCKTTLGVYLPPVAEDKSVPVVYWLSGLTCTEQNFVTKAGSQQFAAQHGVILVVPDTSPRGCNIAGEDERIDLGTGAGFYVDATQQPWSKNYRMYSYITKELPEIIEKNFPAIPGKQSIMGHSMGGHGALICALRNPGKYQSVSAFAPICNPINCPWGQGAFSAYFGENSKEEWKNWDATELVAKYSGPPLELLIDQGKDDPFLDNKQLLPENLVEACKKKGDGIRAILHVREHYNHSYFFIASFIGDHIKYHAKALLD